MKKIFKVIGYVLLGLLLLILLLVSVLVGKAAYNRARFIKETVAILPQAKSPDDIRKLPELYRPDLIYTRQFYGGDWAAVRQLDEEDTEFGFEAALIYTSRGEFWITKSYQFCGYEGMYSDLNGLNPETLDGFVSGASAKFGFSRK